MLKKIDIATVQPAWLASAASLVGVAPEKTELWHDEETGEALVCNAYGLQVPIGNVALTDILVTI